MTIHSALQQTSAGSATSHTTGKCADVAACARHVREGIGQSKGLSPWAKPCPMRLLLLHAHTRARDTFRASHCQRGSQDVQIRVRAVAASKFLEALRAANARRVRP